MQTRPKLFGASYSVYVRITRLTLLEKGIDYELIPIDVFGADGSTSDHLKRHPFGRIPAFEHSGVMLYETSAITRFIDETFEGPALQPKYALERARCNQIISIADNYAYLNLVWGVYVELVSKPQQNQEPDLKRIQAALGIAKTCLCTLEELLGDNLWLACGSLTLADLYMAPMVAYFLQTSEGRELLQFYPSLSAWWSRMSERPSMLNSEFEPTSASG